MPSVRSCSCQEILLSTLALFTRLHRVGRLPLPLTILCVCLHGIKLSQFLPMPLYSSNSSFLSLGGSLVLSLSFLKLTTSDTLSLRLVSMPHPLINFIFN